MAEAITRKNLTTIFAGKKYTISLNTFIKNMCYKNNMFPKICTE